MRTEDADFAADIDAFVARHWPQPEVVTEAHQAHWREALLAQGWSVPGWPAKFGGRDWSPLQQFLMFKACREAGVPSHWDVGAQLVGPALFDSDTGFARARLAEIANMTARWCVAERDIEPTKASADEAGWVLRGVKGGVEHGNAADWMLTRAMLDGSHAAWFCIATSERGVRRGPPHSLDADVCSKIEVRDVGVAEDQQLGQMALEQSAPDGISGLLTRFLAALESLPAESAAAHAAVEIELEALRAMELRWLDATRRGVEPPFPPSVLRLKGEEIFTQLGDLLIDSFGYYALPDMDEALSHNEAPMGPEGFAQFGGVRRILGQIMVRSGQTDPLLRDQIAGALPKNTTSQQEQ